MKSLKEIREFLNEKVDFLMENQDYVGSWMLLNNGLAIVVCWEDGFDKEDKDYFHSKENKEWCLCAGIKVYNKADTPDYWTMLTDGEGNVITESTALTYTEREKDGFETTAEWLLDVYKEVRDADYDSNGVIVKNKDLKSKEDVSIEVEDEPDVEIETDGELEEAKKSKRKSNTVKIKVNQTKLPNKMHFDVQRTTRASVTKAGKGKGSYTRKQKHRKNIIEEVEFL